VAALYHAVAEAHLFALSRSTWRARCCA